MIVVASFEGACRVVRYTTTCLTSPPPDARPVRSRHWHGYLPAWRSLLTWIVVTDLSARILESSANALSAPLLHAPLPYLVARLPFQALSFAICFWGVVGAWRSLVRHKQRARQPWMIHAGLAAIAVVVSILFFQVAFHHLRFASLRTIFVFAGRFQDDQRFVYLAVSSDGRRLVMQGPITIASADEFRHLLDANPLIETVELSSPGGKVFASFAIADDVRRRALNTHALGRCLSACTVVLLAGADRTAPSDVRIGFHATDSARYGYADGALRSYFLEFGLSEAFVDRAMITPNKSMWYPSIRTLLDERVLTRATAADERDDD